jgi:hypothetical protein
MLHDDDGDGAGRCVDDSVHTSKGTEELKDDEDIMGEGRVVHAVEPDTRPEQDSYDTPVGNHHDVEQSELLLAAERGDAVAVKHLLELEGISNINAVHPKTGQTALMVAATHGHAAIVELLLNAGASIQTRDSSGRTAWYAGTPSPTWLFL